MRITGRIITGCLAILLLMVSCQQKKQETPIVMSVDDTLQAAVKVETDSTDTLSAPKIDTSLLPVSREILVLLKEKNYAALAKHVHPAQGVRFSPYAYVDIKKHCRFTAKQLSSINPAKKYTWGSFDGSGDPIHLNISEYFDRFVYNADFLDSAQISQNEFLGTGNSLNNLQEIYRGCDFTEFYFRGSDPKLEGMDWSAIRLVFKTEKGQPYLVAIVHDQWTI
jgi:hypothetical protein